MSFNLINLPAHLRQVGVTFNGGETDRVTFCSMLRYRTANLLLTAIMPGPKEPDPEQVQGYMRVLINELIRLWRDGVVICTPSCPNGRRVRVILVAVVCDKPAAHKLGAFGSHTHRLFCTRCWIDQASKSSPQAFTRNGKLSY